MRIHKNTKLNREKEERNTGRKKLKNQRKYERRLVRYIKKER